MVFWMDKIVARVSGICIASTFVVSCYLVGGKSFPKILKGGIKIREV